MMLRRIIQGVLERWRLGRLSGLAAMARDNLYWKRRFVRFDITLDDWSPPLVGPPELDVRRGSLEELVGIRRRWTGSPLPLEFRADLIHAFDWFYLGTWNGDIAHIAWVVAAPKQSAFMGCGPGEAEITFSYTLGAHRGRGIYTHCTSAILSDLKRLGFRRIYGHVLEGNTPSQRGMLRIGYRQIGTVRWWRFLGLRGVRYRPFEGIEQ